VIAQHDKPARIPADQHPVQAAGDLQFAIVSQQRSQPLSFIILLAVADDRIAFVHVFSPHFLLGCRAGHLSARPYCRVASILEVIHITRQQ
jgi:hypothetical protein